MITRTHDEVGIFGLQVSQKRVEPGLEPGRNKLGTKCGDYEDGGAL